MQRNTEVGLFLEAVNDLGKNAVEADNDIKNKLLEANQDIRRIIHEATSIDGLPSESLDGWLSTTARIQRQLSEGTIRVAVVGSIKSGKSSLTNSLFGGDYLKRGAGVVTSIITKVRPGQDLTAKLEFKAWDEINAEINQALILFSSIQSDATGGYFDINSEKDRLRLQQDLSKLNTEQLISDDARDPNSVLLTEYLKGYDRVKDFVSFDPTTLTFDSDDLHRQKDFVGDQSLAVYLKDVCLTLKAPEAFGDNIEIADCQGSDSPNPLHLAMIQDYLVQNHVTIYVLSSRTGVRQSDIKFLTLIKKMGLTKNLLFVLNCDLTEHETLDDLKGLVSKAEEEIDMIISSPRLFSFSALYNLFKGVDSEQAVENTLSRKDRIRLEQWREDADMVAFSDEQTEKFMETVTHTISMDRFALLLESNLERTSNAATSMLDWVQINHDLLHKDAEKVQEAFSKMDKRRRASGQVTDVIRDTLDGTTSKIRQNLGDQVERFFDPQYAHMVQEINNFIDSYNLPIIDHEDKLQTLGFLPTLYRIFQALRQAADQFLAESVNPKLVHFVRQEEKNVEEVFDRVTGPYGLMIQDAVSQHQQTMEDLGINIGKRAFKTIRPPDVGSVASDAQLSIPRLVGTMQYTARIRTEAILRLGFYSTVNGVKRLLKRPVAEGAHGAMRSLEDSVRRIKDQMRESITHQLMDYKENLKYQYLFKLVDAMSSRLYESLTDRMTAFSGSLLDVRGLIESEREAKDDLIKRFASMQTDLNKTLDKIRDVERLVQSHTTA